MTSDGRLPLDEQLARFEETLRRNRTLTEVLAQAAGLDLPGWYLVAGCLCQTVWNVVSGQPPEAASSTTTWPTSTPPTCPGPPRTRSSRPGTGCSAICRSVQIRNQARVHLWYEEKFGIGCPPHESTEAAIDTYEATTACLGVRAEPGGRWRVYAPHGLSDAFNLVVRPNPVLAPPGVYRAKTERWQRQWPALTVLPWPAPA